MHALTRDQFLEILGLSSGAFDQLQYEGGVALAFGSPIPGTPGRYLDLDLVAMWIALDLTDRLKRDIATTVVLGFFTNWVRAVARAEADRSQDFFFAIGAFGVKNFAKRIPKLYGVADGTRDEINEDFDRQPEQPLVSALFVNVSNIVRRLQERAHKAGINLEAPFFFLPDDPRFSEILQLVERERDERIARLRKDKKKFAVAKARKRRRDIEVISRVKNPYPIEMTA